MKFKHTAGVSLNIKLLKYFTFGTLHIGTRKPLPTWAYGTAVSRVVFHLNEIQLNFNNRLVISIQL